MTRSIQELLDTLQEFDSESFANEINRHIAKDALIAALRRVQRPWDVVYDHVWQQPIETAAIKTLIGAGFWREWTKAGSRAGKIDELAALGHRMDPMLLRRLLRMLAGQHFVREVSTDTFGPTPYSKALGQENVASVYTFLYELQQPKFANFPKFAAETGYKNPSDATRSNWHSWQGPGSDVFPYLVARPELMIGFNDGMTLYADSKMSWTDMYSTGRIIDNFQPDRVLVVDIGGGLGQDLERFQAKYPNVPSGSLVLQDLPDVVADSSIRPPTRVQGHDFFTPQPIVGARVYYLHSVLHNWSDEKAVQILKFTSSAMDKSFSKVLLHELVVPAEKAQSGTTQADLTMMMTYSTEERTENTWRALVIEAEFRVVKIWTVPGQPESIIELELA